MRKTVCVLSLLLLPLASACAFEGPKLTVEPSARPVRRTWPEVKAAIAASIDRTAYGYYAYSRSYNDIGPIDTSGTLTDEELKTQFALACVLASPITVKGPARPQVAAWLADGMLMNVNDDKVARQGHVVVEADGVFVLKKYLWGMNGDHAAVAYYNPTERARTVSVTPRDLEFAGTVKWTDRFDTARSGSFDGPFAVTVPAHGAVLHYVNGTPALRENYRVECARRSADRPALVWDCVHAPKSGDYRLEIVSASQKPVTLNVNGLVVGSFAGSGAVTARLFAPENRVMVSGEGIGDIKSLHVQRIEER